MNFRLSVNPHTNPHSSPHTLYNLAMYSSIRYLLTFSQMYVTVIVMVVICSQIKPILFYKARQLPKTAKHSP
jgi:hypothetical protein